MIDGVGVLLQSPSSAARRRAADSDGQHGQFHLRGGRRGSTGVLGACSDVRSSAGRRNRLANPAGDWSVFRLHCHARVWRGQKRHTAEIRRRLRRPAPPGNLSSDSDTVEPATLPQNEVPLPGEAAWSAVAKKPSNESARAGVGVKWVEASTWVLRLAARCD